MKNTKCKILKTNKKGFSMLEVMVAIFVIVVGMVGAISLLSAGLSNSMDSRNQVIAALLSQEGVELVRNIRDSNWVTGGNTFNNLPTADYDNCAISYSSSILSNTDCNKTLSQETLSYVSNFYVTSSVSPTKFKRKITIDYDTGSSATAQTVTVTSMAIWGASFPAASNCNTGNKCSYSTVTLSKWGEAS